MTQEELSKLTDQELLVEAKKMKSASITNAGFIGLLIGVVIYSVAKSSFGFLTLIPIYLVYKLWNKPENYDALKSVLKERGLK